MLHVNIKGILVCLTFVNTKIVGVLALLGQSKFSGLTLFRDVNEEGVDTMLAAIAH
jgi:hypothetical protein